MTDAEIWDGWFMLWGFVFIVLVTHFLPSWVAKDPKKEYFVRWFIVFPICLLILIIWGTIGWLAHL